MIGGLIGLFRWFGDRRSEREKRAEERFQSAVTGLGGEKDEVKIGAAITLRTFLRPGYEQFYTQTFDLAVAHLRFPRTPDSSEDPNPPLPLTTLRQALIVVFKEAFLLSRNLNKGNPQFLDASRIQLDNAYLREADLKQVWMRQAFLREASLFKANFSEAHLTGTNFSGADLNRANFSRAYLRGTNFSRANSTDANFSKARLTDANFSKARLRRANLTEANIEDASTLEDTVLHGVIGLTKEQLEACKAKGAIIDEASTTSSSQSVVSPPPSSQSNDG